VSGLFAPDYRFTELQILKLVLLVVLIGTIGAAVIGDKSNARCGDNEVWSECPSCESSCAEPIRACSLTCHNPGCVCIEGYVRNEDGKCVQMESCALEE
uniref:TIL domain-containing protein n=1 Tax=Steinernema glaseri TaxID=37863 RepID=A0A1I8AGJ7_9BILA